MHEPAAAGHALQMAGRALKAKTNVPGLGAFVLVFGLGWLDERLFLVTTVDAD